MTKATQPIHECATAAVALTPAAKRGTEPDISDAIAIPPLDAFRNYLHIGVTRGYELVRTGELPTFMIGARRFTTLKAIAALIQHCIEQSAEEPGERAKKMVRLIEASLRARRRRE